MSTRMENIYRRMDILLKIHGICVIDLNLWALMTTLLRVMAIQRWGRFLHFINFGISQMILHTGLTQMVIEISRRLRSNPKSLYKYPQFQYGRRSAPAYFMTIASPRLIAKP